jgi:hypothetical protein
MPKRKKPDLVVPAGADPLLWKLIPNPPATARELWKSLDPPRRKELLVSILADPEHRDDFLESVVDELKGFRAKALAERPGDEVADLLERHGIGVRFARAVLFNWAAYASKDPFLIFTRSIHADEDEAGTVRVGSNRVTIQPDRIPLAGKRVLAHSGPDAAILLSLIFFELETVMQPGLRVFFNELLTRPFDDLMDEAVGLLSDYEVDVDEEDEEDEEDEGSWSEAVQAGAGSFDDFETTAEAEEALDDLAARLARLADHLAAAAESAQAGGLPSLDIIEEIAEVRARYGDLRAKLCGEIGVDPEAEELTELETLEALRVVLAGWRDLNEEGGRFDRASAVLAAVLRLEHETGEPFLPLKEAQDRARALQEQLQDGDAAALADGSQALAHLLETVRAAAAGDRGTASRLGPQLSADLGADLAFAAGLGQVHEGPATVEPAGAVDADSLPAEPETATDAPDHSEPEQPAVDTQAPEPSSESDDGLLDVVNVRDDVPPAVSEATAPEAAVDAPPGATEPPADKVTEDERAEDPLTELASAALAVDGDRRAARIEALAARLIEEGESVLAVHLTRWSEAELGTDARMPAWLTEALALAPHVNGATGELFIQIRDCFARHDAQAMETGDPAWDQGLALLLAAATLRPALLAPATLAPLALGGVSFKEGLPALWEYCQLVSEQTKSGSAIDPMVLRRVQDQAEWERAMEDLKERVGEWLSRAPRTTMAYAAATTVWQALLKKDAPLYALFQPVRTNDRKRIAWVQGEVARLSDPTEVRRLVDETDRHVVGRKRGQPIIAKAYGKIQAKLGEALALAREWLDLVAARPGEDHTFRIEQADRIRRETLTRHGPIRAELDGLNPESQPAVVRAGVCAMRDALDDIERVFSGEGVVSREEPPAVRVLNAPLLQTERVSLDEDWALDRETTGSVADGVLALLKDDLPRGWRATLARRTALGDHVGTDLVLAQVEHGADPDSMAELDALRAQRQTRIAEERARVRRHVSATQHDVERAVMHGLLREGERADLIDRVVRVEDALATGLAFHRLAAELDAVSADVSVRRAEQVEEVRGRLEALGLPADDEAYGRVVEVLAMGDVLTANEYLLHIERDIPLPPKDVQEANPFEAFFPNALSALEQWNMPNAAQVVRMVRSRDKVPGVDLSGMADTQAELAADMLGHWYRVRGQRGAVDGKMLKSVFGFLGFNVLGTSGQSAGAGSTRAWAEITTEPVRDRAQCPVAHYGSRAAHQTTSTEANYRVFLAWNEPAPEDLIGAVGEKKDPPIFVLYFGTLNTARRRTLARLSRVRKRTFLVIDEYLLLHLAGETQGRMPAMYACTLPFTFIEPYASTSGTTPPEEFFGRDSERRKLMDPTGSCVIYGGRQLGKTALLKDVERRYHNPGEHRYALYMDILREVIEKDQAVDAIWPHLARRLKAMDIVPASVPDRVQPGKLLGEVEAWLAADARRRLLLLLDEADGFMEADTEQMRIGRLKGLMDATERRFKVVFAGLHNVQRSTRLANTPLAHLGQPLCIGPLFEDGEWRHARDMIQKPLQSVGYVFESPELVTRILSQTNWYPSLLSLYGAQLLHHVSRPDAETVDAKDGPPYELTQRTVEDAYQSQDLWQWIRDRFRWTLQLDPRYHLIALDMAHRAGFGELAGSDGFSVRDIRQSALSWWPQGFADDRSEDCFRVLLDEMVGLGILRETGPGRYALRSGNVRLLMGTPEEVEDTLLDLVEKDPPQGYEPTTFRRSLDDGSGEPRERSPLTAQQESALRQPEHGVSIVFGTEAAGLGGLTRLLPMVFGEEYLIRVPAGSDRDGLVASLAQLRSRKRDGVTLFFAGTDCDWDTTWLTEALARVAAIKSRTSHVRVLFVAGPQHAARLAAENDQLLRWTDKEEVTTFTLGPWHDATVRALLDELRVPANLLDRHLASVRSLTGKWPALLYELVGGLHGKAASKWGAEFERFEATWAPGAAEINARAQAFGLVDGAPIAPLRMLATVGHASAADLASLLEQSPEEVEGVLVWADRLGLTLGAPGGEWQLDPIVERLLTALEADEPSLVVASGS